MYQAHIPDLVLQDADISSLSTVPIHLEPNDKSGPVQAASVQQALTSADSSADSSAALGAPSSSRHLMWQVRSQACCSNS